MTTSLAPLSISGGSRVKARELGLRKPNSFGNISMLAVQRKSNQLQTERNLSVSAQQRDGGVDFVAGFLLGGAVVGALAYIYAPQLKRFALNENEHGFQRPKGPIYYADDPDYYYDEGLQKTRKTLNAKIRQLNSAIDSVYKRLRGGISNSSPTVPVETDPEEATA